MKALEVETEAHVNGNLRTWAEQIPFQDQDPQTQAATIRSAIEAIDGHHAWSPSEKAAKHAEFQGMVALAVMRRVIAEAPGAALKMLMAPDFMEKNPEFAFAGGEAKRQELVNEARERMRPN
jgi:hypothetical protein